MLYSRYHVQSLHALPTTLTPKNSPHFLCIYPPFYLQYQGRIMPLKDDFLCCSTCLSLYFWFPLYYPHLFPYPPPPQHPYCEIWANEVNGPLKEPETSITMTTGDSSITKWKTYAPDIFTAVPAAERNLGMGNTPPPPPPPPGDLGITLFWLVYDPQGPCIYKVEAVVLILELALL